MSKYGPIGSGYTYDDIRKRRLMLEEIEHQKRIKREERINHILQIVAEQVQASSAIKDWKTKNGL